MYKSIRRPVTVACSTVSAACADERRQSFLRLRQLAGQEFAFRPVELQRKGQLMPPLPAILRQQGRASSQISERRGVGRRRLGALARDQVELGQLLAFRGFDDQRDAAIELADDLEDRLLRRSGSVCAANSRPIRRCSAARDASGISE